MTFAQYGDFLRAVGESCDGSKGRQVVMVRVRATSTLASEGGGTTQSELRDRGLGWGWDPAVALRSCHMPSPGPTWREALLLLG